MRISGVGCPERMSAERWLRAVLLVLVVVFVGTLVSPYKLLVVRSDSMEPVLPVGCILVVNRVGDASLLAAGDIVTYQRPGVPFTITHRIVDVTKDGFATKGDNLNETDGVVRREWVRYRVVGYLLFSV